MNRYRIVPAAALALAIAAGPAIAQTPAPAVPMAEKPSDQTKTIQDSITVLTELATASDNAIPQYLLERAEAIVVIPSLLKGGFIVGAKHGKGVMSVRDRTRNTWSAPAFVNLTGGSIGWQIGAEAVDLVLLVMNQKGVTELLEDRFTLGGSLSVAAGPVGRTADAATNAQFNAEILAYSRSRGLFAGATLEGAALHAAEDDNAAFYGEPCGVKEIVLGQVAGTMPAGVTTWRTAVMRLTAAR